MLVYWIQAVTRWLVLAAFVLACVVVATHWAVRRGRLKAFGPWARFVRSASDPMLRPIERRIIRFGRNPQDAPLWLAGVVLVGGLLTLAVVNWVINAVFYTAALAHGGARVWIGLVVNLAYWVLAIALLVRVLGSWMGGARFTGAMRLAHRLTDWLVEPIRRLLPPLGPLDLSPLVAWFALILLRAVLLRFLMA